MIENTRRSMVMVQATVAAVALALIGADVAAAQLRGAAGANSDRIQRRNGADVGEIKGMTALGVTIAKSGVDTTVPAEEIRSIRFAGEPSELNAARIAAAAGRPREAYDASIAAAKTGPKRPEVMAEAQFLAASSQAAMAFAGQESLDAAAGAMKAFLGQQRTNYHIPAAIELYGDLLVRAGKYDEARTEFAKLAKAKSKYFEARSHLLLGQAWQAEGDAAKALAEFDLALAATTGEPIMQSVKLAATLDRAVSQAAAGDPKQAAAALGKIIAGAAADDAELLARAYNALGEACQKSGDVQGALYAYLHVDLLLADVGDEHARALSQLAKLWKTAGQPARASDAAERLAEKYPNSRWAGE